MKTSLHLSHIAFWVGDMQKSLRFYRDILGLEPMYSLEHEDGTPWLTCLKVNEGTYLELFPADGHFPKRKDKAQSYFHFALEVEDIKAAIEELQEQGMELYRFHDDKEAMAGVDPIRPQCRSCVCWIKDPDGNEIELIEYTEESLQIKSGLKRQVKK